MLAGAAVHVGQGDGHGVLDGLPLHALEEGGKGDGDVGEHKEGEGEGVEDLLGGGGSDVFPRPRRA